nr:hypothetical protein [Halomonas sp. UBA3173]
MFNQGVDGVLKGARLELILVVDHHHGVLIVALSFEARPTEHSSSVFSILPELSRQWFFLQPQRPKQQRPQNSGGRLTAPFRGELFLFVMRAY